jgi:hypothetical protein
MANEQPDKNTSIVLEQNLTKVRYSPYPCRQRRAPDRFVFPENHRCTDDYGSHEHDSDPFGGDSSDDSSLSSDSTVYTKTGSTSSDTDSFCVSDSSDDESIFGN